MADETELSKLANTIRQVLPRTITGTSIELDTQNEVVMVTYNNGKFAVKLSGEVFEIKAKNLFITGSSLLIQCIVSKRKKGGEQILQVLDVLTNAEEFSRSNKDLAIAKIRDAKAILTRLIKVTQPSR